MSVSATISLPSAIDDGVVDRIPLGGDGKVAPHSAYMAYVSVTGDASAGTATLRINLDPRYTSLIQYCMHAVQTPGAAEAQRLIIGEGGLYDVLYNTNPLLYSSVTDQSSLLWTPPAAICSPDDITDCYIMATKANANGVLSWLMARIYCFDKRARELTPLPILLASAVR